MERAKRIRVRLNQKEKELIARKVSQSVLSREAYMRQLLDQIDIPEKPQPDYQGYSKRLHEIGIELNYVARKLHVLGVIGVQKYDETYRRF